MNKSIRVVKFKIFTKIQDQIEMLQKKMNGLRKTED